MNRPTTVNPATGEKIAAPRLGVYLTSKTRRWNDDSEPALQTPVGGYVITCGDDCWEVVDVHRGQPVYTVIDEEEIDWDAYDGFVNVAYLRGVARILNMAQARTRNIDEQHLHALLALSRAMELR